MGPELGKLEKLKIFAFDNPGRNGNPKGTFVAMFNPASYAQTHTIPWSDPMPLNSEPSLKYVGSLSSSLALNLVLDGTGVDDPGDKLGERPSVKERVSQFFEVTLHYQGSIHEPYYLCVEWGSLIFLCRLAQVTTKYTAFDRQGNPLRAELAIQLLADLPSEVLAKKLAKKSPDLTHSRVVRSGETLPLLTRQMYGSPDSYLLVARYNGLKDFRRLIPGQELLFPPLIQLKGQSSSGQR